MQTFLLVVAGVADGVGEAVGEAVGVADALGVEVGEAIDDATGLGLADVVEVGVGDGAAVVVVVHSVANAIVPQTATINSPMTRSDVRYLLLADAIGFQRADVMR